MPYFITDESPDCDGWGVVKTDGELIGCHTTMQAAIDQMVAVSLAEGIEPGGRRDNGNPAVIADIDDTIVRNGTEPIREVIDRINSLPGDLFVLTGRAERQRASTTTTLNNAGLRSFQLLMAPDDDANAVAFKMAETLRIMETHYVTHVFENDAATRDAYAELGLTVVDLQKFDDDDATWNMERVAMHNVEIRTFDAEVRAVDESSDGMTFGGYAWRYNEPSLPLPFTERIQPGAFKRTLKARNDIRAYYNHNDELLLGSTRAKTLRIDDREDGGYVEIDLPDTEIGRSTAYHIRRGDITGMSFGFSTVRDSWSEDGNERMLEEVRLHEVSVVSGVPAYPSTTASVRNLKIIAHRTDTDADALADAMSAMQSGELTDDQADILRTVVDRMTGAKSEPEPTVPLSLLQKQIDLLAKAF